MADIIVTKNLKKNYIMGEVLVPVLRGVNLKIEEGSFVSIIGASGSGKTTLLNQIGLLDIQTSGEVIIKGVNIKNLNHKKKSKLRLRKIGFIFQFFDLLPELTAIENVMLPMQVLGELNNKKIEKRAKELIEIVGLKERMHHKPAQLSGGQMQRAAIARALANDPEIILADDPTAGLDDNMTIQIAELLENITKKQKKTIIVVTHDKIVADRTDKILRLVDGKVFDESAYSLEYIEKKIAEMIGLLEDNIKKLSSSKSIDGCIIILKNIGRLSNEISFLDLKEEEDIISELKEKLSGVLKKATKKIKYDIHETIHKEEEIENKIYKACNVIQNTSNELMRTAVIEKHKDFCIKMDKDVKVMKQQLKLLKELRVKEELLKDKVKEKLGHLIGISHKRRA
ncbi:ATP-binding cassette domain-containing protein [Candidatus Woesearchaeota archaeon]|nr:ATP-binding cassette domain-containing protein [Candidatus Woesearchaeota archaeon]